ncbi:hypothetical protein A7P89_10945 [Eikenella corrodens]|uniref:Uncharacterized protein n=1 Tax=Eikenella corrodens TaxID=539 RepID=A0A1A9RM71_EIKCO|nr:hypothetical protein [Eikenella corrodens]OAM19921.1 hypothetical protein A7P89_10945 [Eikenella corrodens]
MDWQQYFLLQPDGVSYATNFNNYLTFVVNGYNSLIPPGQPDFSKPVYLGVMMSPGQLAVLRANRHLFDESFNNALERLQESYDRLKIEVG